MDDLFVDFHACINCLGSVHNGKFVKDADTIVSIRGILKYLRKESSQCEVRVEFGKFNLIEQCIMPLMKSNYNDAVLFELIIRLLMNITQPAFIVFREEQPSDVAMMEIYIKIDKILQKYKTHFADVEFLGILASSINEIFNKLWEDRSEDDHMIVQIILILMRNILHIKDSVVDGKIPDGIRSQHDKLIKAMMDSGWKELLIFISNTEDETRFAFHILEITSLIFREQTSDSMKISRNNDSPKLTSKPDLLREQGIESMQRSTTNPRALRFGGTFVLTDIKSTSGRPMIYHHDISSGKIDLNRDRKKNRKSKNRLPNTEEVYQHKSPENILKSLQAFSEQFLKFGYNSLMKTARSCLVRQHAQPGDETYYLWALHFFTSVCRSNHFDPTFVSETLSEDVFNWLYNESITYLDLAKAETKNAKSRYRKLHLVTSAYKELLQFLLMLDRHQKSEFQKISATLKCQVFYQEEYLDFYPMLLMKFNPVLQSRSQLRDLIEGSCLIIKILQNHKLFDMSVVRKLKKKRTKRKPTPKSTVTNGNGIPMPSDNSEELLPIWERIVQSITLAVRGQLELPDNEALPCIFDPLLATDLVEPIEFGTAPIDSQLKRALGITQIYLRQEKPVEAVAVFRQAQVLWPEEERISVVDSDNPFDEEISILNRIMMAPRFYLEEDLIIESSDHVAGFTTLPEIEDEEEGGGGDSEFEDSPVTTIQEVAFDLEKFLMKFCHPRMINIYGVIFGDFAVNPTKTNSSLLQIMYCIAHRSKMPYVLYQLNLFHGFSKFLQDPRRMSTEFKEIHKFIIFLIRKFTVDCANNNKLLIEILFNRTHKEAWQTVHGYEDIDEKGNMWTDDMDEELTRLYNEALTEDILPGHDPIHVVENRISDPTKTRRQIIARLINLGIIKSVKDFKKKRITPQWTGDEQARLIILVEESRDQPKPIREIMNGLKATATDVGQLKTQRVVVEKILELNLVSNAEQLGIVSRTKNKGKANDSSDDDIREDDNEEARFVENLLENQATAMDDLDGFVVRREPPPLKPKRMVDWTSFKMTYARLNATEKEWFIEMISDNIDSRDNGIVGHLAIVPLLESESVILDNFLVQKLLSLCFFECPSDVQGHQFWRIPENMSSKELWYFKNCASSLTAEELKALDIDEKKRQSKTVPSISPIALANVPAEPRERTNMDFDSLSEREDDQEDKENALITKKLKRKSFQQLLSSDEDESSYQTIDFINQSKPHENFQDSPLSKEKKNKRIIIDSDDEEDEEVAPVSLKKRARIIDDDDMD